ncbi:hypothetical protein MVEN_01556300 [Mycena venus]|uniref:Uncharacterized protein n=1 Tax=Mycena venus TaxID=2733690 RepID=A0A8H7CPI6_9AGAR|nr:hypothetical protein MVEN_01556300 [Mycena venus]
MVPGSNANNCSPRFIDYAPVKYIKDGSAASSLQFYLTDFHLISLYLQHFDRISQQCLILPTTLALFVVGQPRNGAAVAGISGIARRTICAGIGHTTATNVMRPQGMAAT